MQFGSAGAGSAHISACVLLNAAIGVNVTHVPYRGGAPAMQDLIAGRIDYLCTDTPIALPQIEARAIKAHRDPDARALRRACRICRRRRAGARRISKRRTGRLLPAEGHAGADRGEAARRHGRGDGHAGRAGADARTIGVDLVAPERRSPEYLAKFVETEIAKWAGPIKASGW